MPFLYCTFSNQEVDEWDIFIEIVLGNKQRNSRITVLSLHSPLLPSVPTRDQDSEHQ